MAVGGLVVTDEDKTTAASKRRSGKTKSVRV